MVVWYRGYTGRLQLEAQAYMGLWVKWSLFIRDKKVVF